MTKLQIRLMVRAAGSFSQMGRTDLALSFIICFLKCLFIYLLIYVCVGVLAACMFVCHICAWPFRGQKRTFDTLGL